MKEKQEQKIGVVKSFFSKINVAAIALEADLKIGDKIRVKGATTDFQQKVASMQIDREEITEASQGDEIGIKVKERVRPNDFVYRI